MTRIMHDAVTASAIPSTAKMVAGYLNGSVSVWSAADWALFPDAIKVEITVFASTNAGHVLDVENGDATPEQAPGWVVMRRKAGADPTVYCGYGSNGEVWAAVINAFKSAGVPEPQYWVAAYPGIGPSLYPGSVCHQHADPSNGSGGNFDLSVVADFWPGVDTHTAPPAPRKAPLMQLVQAPAGTVIYMTDGMTKRHVGTPGELPDLLRIAGQPAVLVIGQWTIDRIPDMLAAAPPVAAPVDVKALAAAIIAGLPPNTTGLTAAAIATAVSNDLEKRLAT